MTGPEYKPSAHRVSGSRVSLALVCSYWARPDVDVPDDPPGPPAQQGTALHELAEQYLADEPLVDVDRAIAKRWAVLQPWLAAWRDKLRAAGAVRFVEEAWAYDVDRDTVRSIPRKADRNYEAGPREVPIRIDLGAVYPDGTFAVWDLKTGRKAPSARGNGQLLTGGLALGTAHGVSRGTLHVVHVEDSGVTDYAEPVEPWDLEAHAFDLRAMLDALPEGRPMPGVHCSAMYCALRTCCPALGEAVPA